MNEVANIIKRCVELEAVILTESFHILNSTPSSTKTASGLHFRAHARAGGGGQDCQGTYVHIELVLPVKLVRMT